MIHGSIIIVVVLIAGIVIDRRYGKRISTLEAGLAKLIAKVEADVKAKV